MALNTEIDALLASADTQGVTIEQVLQQVYLRSQSEALPDEYPALVFTDWLGSSDWPTLHTYLADITTDMPLEVAWSRAWAAEVGEDEDTFLRYMLQIIRCLGRANQYNLSFPSFALKSKLLTGSVEFAL